MVHRLAALLKRFRLASTRLNLSLINWVILIIRNLRAFIQKDCLIIKILLRTETINNNYKFEMQVDKVDKKKKKN